MKKRILSLIIAIILIIPCFTVDVFAISAQSIPDPYDSAKFNISADYQTLTFNDAIYVRFDASVTDWEYSSSYTDKNCDYIDNLDYVEYDFSPNNNIITACINYLDGSYYLCYFIKENLLPEHQNMMNSASEYIVSIDYPNTAKIPLTANQLSDEVTSIDSFEFGSLYSYYVNVYSSDDSFCVQKGELALIDNEYYYVDYNLNNITNANRYTDDSSSYTGYKVIDTELIAKLDKETGNNQTDFIDLIFSGELFTGFGNLLLFAIFALIPLAVFVLFLILLIRAKTPVYKKLFTAICITSVLELVVFVVSVIFLIVFK